MPTTAVSPATSSPQTAASRALGRGLGTMKSEDFFRILVSELRQQDPFEPAKTSDLVNQVSQIRGIELSSQLTSSLEQLAGQQRGESLGGLIGRYVSATITDAAGTQALVEGVVTGVRFDAETPVLELDSGQSIPAESVTRVTTLEQAEREKSGAASGAKLIQPPVASAALPVASANAAASSHGGATAASAKSASTKPAWLTLGGLLNL
ncbi:MAG: flagellar hook assembly protein FlgD [Phycisphaerae bacterium]